MISTGVPDNTHEEAEATVTRALAMKALPKFVPHGALAVLAAALLLPTSADGANATPKDGTIAYVLTDLHWAIYQTPDAKAECPQGFNEGNREQFKKLFPDDGQKRTLVETQLRREIDGWYPTTAPDPFPFKEAGGPTAY